MEERVKILILEHDDFLREILGNLLYKKGLSILNGTTIEQGLKETEHQLVSCVILGTSCIDFRGTSSIHFIKKQFGNDVDIFIINTESKALDYHPSEKQIMVKDLSVSKIIDYFTS